MFNRRFLYAALTSALAILFHGHALAQVEDRTEAIKEITALRKELNEKEKLFLAPAAEDQNKFAEFLKQPDTGLIRLFPRGSYDEKLAVYGGASYHSFSSARIGSPDIELYISQLSNSKPPSAGLPGGELDQNGSSKDRPIYDGRTPFPSASGAGSEPNPYRRENFGRPSIAVYVLRTLSNYGFILALGKISIEKVALEHKGVKFLAAFNPPSTKAEERAVYRRDYNIFRINRLAYVRETEVSVNQTYALRSIRYDKSDVLVVFHVVRKEKDGSLIILWKRLKESPATPAPQ
jgi:hypothetical protein